MGLGEQSTGRRESVLGRMTSGYEKAGRVLRTVRNIGHVKRSCGR